MSTSYQAKGSQQLSRQLAAQEIVSVCDLVAGTSDAPAIVAVDNSTIAATVITLDVAEAIASCFVAQVVNRATGANVTLAAAPDVSVAQKISVTVNGTALASVCVKFVYKVQE